MYFLIVLIMVLISIFAIAYGTEPSSQRSMTNCERLDFMIANDWNVSDSVAGVLLQNCDNTTIPELNETQQRLAGYNPGDSLGDLYDQDYSYMHVLDYGDVSDGVTTARPQFVRVKVPDMKTPIYSLVVLEALTLAFFTVEFVIRLMVCPNILRYFMSIINVVEAVSLIAAYVYIIIASADVTEKYKDNWKNVFDYMQMLRAVRLFRILKNLRASQVLAHSLLTNLKGICISLVYLAVGLCIFSSCFYLLEERYVIRSIPDGWYFAMITMTTVGYGDFTLQSSWGRVMSCLCAFCGVILFALTVPILVGHFLTLYQYSGMMKKVGAAKIANREGKGSSNCGNNPVIVPQPASETAETQMVEKC